MIRMLPTYETYYGLGSGKAYPVTVVRAYCDACDCAAMYHAIHSSYWAEFFCVSHLERTCWALDKFDPRTLRGYPAYE